MIQEYLLNPHNVGVYWCSFDLKIKDIEKLLVESVKFDKDENRMPESYNSVRFSRIRDDEPNPWLIEDFKNALRHLNIYKPKESPLGPWQLKIPFEKVVTEKAFHSESILEDRYRNMMLRYPSASSFLENYQSSFDKKNAINIDLTLKKDVLRVNLFSLKKEGINKHKEFLESIPIIGKNLKTSKIYHKYSSRYCYKVYPSAMIVWACNISDNPIPRDILHYLVGAVRYYTTNEWRVSIVLSAIAVETIFAELYEEIKHKPAPPDTLGSLFSQISKLIEIPDEIKADVEEVNNNRILAVHRSSMQLGDREARSSLVGATRFTHWTYFKSDYLK